MKAPIINYDQLTKMVGRNETSISNEIARAKEAETDLGNNITHYVGEETSRAVIAETALGSRLDTVETIAKGATRAKTFLTYAAMVEELLQMPSDTYNPGQSFLIATVNVPDLWVYGIVASYNEYEFQSDEDFVNELKSTGVVHIGYFLVSALETQKVDLSTYVEAYVGDALTVTNPLSGTDCVSYSYNSGSSFCKAYLSSTITPTKEQMIGAAYAKDDRNNPESYRTATIEIGDINEEESNDDGLCITINSTAGLFMFVVYSTNYHPSFFDAASYFPKPGIYLTESEYYGDSPYIVSVDVWIIPPKQIDNRLIDLKNHPDFIIPEPDMANYVKKTDEVGILLNGAQPAGITLNYASACGLLMKEQKGYGKYLSISAADEDIVTKRNGIYPLVANTLDTYMKIGVTGKRKKQVNGVWQESLGNQIALTAAEKNAAKTWLGVPKYFGDLEYKPFSGHEEIAISFSDAGQPIYVNGFETYLQTTKVYPPDVFVGASVSYYNEQRYEDKITDGFIVNKNEKGYTIRIGSSYIYCVYDVNYLGGGFPSTGIYFSYLYDGDEYYVSFVHKTGTPISYLDNAYLDLANHNVIKSLLARIEALENK